MFRFNEKLPELLEQVFWPTNSVKSPNNITKKILSPIISRLVIWIYKCIFKF